MLSFITGLTLVANLALAAPLSKRTNDCVTPSPMRNGVAGCSASDIAGAVPALNLLTAGNFAALSQTGISAVPATSIIGNIGVAPAALTYVTGFSLSATGGSYYSTSYMVDGKVYGADSTSSPTPLAVDQAESAYTNGQGRDNYSYRELSNGTLDNLSLYKGVYNWSTDVNLHDGESLFLNGNEGDVFIFQSSNGFFFGFESQIVLGGTLTQDSIYFVAATSVTIGNSAAFYGIALAHNDITVEKNAICTGHLYSQTQISFLKGSSLTGPNLD